MKTQDMIEDWDWSSIEDYDIEQAKKLYRNIEVLKNIFKIEVVVGGTKDLKQEIGDWCESYQERIKHTRLDHEMESLSIIRQLKDSLKVYVERSEEAFRKVIIVADRRNAKVKKLRENLENIKDQNKTFKDEIQNLKYPKPVEEKKPNKISEELSTIDKDMELREKVERVFASKKK